MPVVIFHNPKCTKSRQTVRLLEDRQLKFEIVEYLRTPPDATELRRILKLLDMTPRDLMRKTEPEYRQLHLDDPALSEAALIQALPEHPQLIERPIVVAGNRAALGRPPENVLKILE